jgi:AcrR family transcriptional regulator
MKETILKKAINDDDLLEAENKATMRKDMVRERLLDKAADLFIRRGYANTRLQDIAEELGLTRSALYHYFHSKDEILETLTKEAAAKSVTRLEAIRANPKLTAAERLHATVSGNVFNKLSDSIRFRMLDRIEHELPDAMREEFLHARRRVLELTIKIIEDGIDAGEFRRVDTKIAAFSIIGMTNWTAWWYSPKGERSPTEIADAMADLVVSGVRSGSPGNVAPDLTSALAKLKQDVAAVEQLWHATNQGNLAPVKKSSLKKPRQK